MITVQKEARYKPLYIGVELPAELEEDIQKFLDYINGPGKHTSEDGYRADIYFTINWCIRENKLDRETCDTLKNYYVYEGIYKQS